jgi:DNA-directed RNA polymerase sigma subunit (sigma70/sigma32)
MNVTDFDERNIKYFAGRYACNAAPYEDLVQEGWVAALESKKPEHKYNNIRQAIRVSKKQAVFLPPTSYDPQYAEESKETKMIETLDQLRHLLTNTTLTTKEQECIDLIYFGEEKTLTQASKASEISKQAMEDRHKSAMRKLRVTLRKEQNHAS